MKCLVAGLWWAIKIQGTDAVNPLKALVKKDFIN